MHLTPAGVADAGLDQQPRRHGQAAVDTRTSPVRSFTTSPTHLKRCRGGWPYTPSFTTRRAACLGPGHPSWFLAGPPEALSHPSLRQLPTVLDQACRHKGPAVLRNRTRPGAGATIERPNVRFFRCPCRPQRGRRWSRRPPLLSLAIGSRRQASCRLRLRRPPPVRPEPGHLAALAVLHARGSPATGPKASTGHRSYGNVTTRTRCSRWRSRRAFGLRDHQRPAEGPPTAKRPARQRLSSACRTPRCRRCASG